MSILNLFRRKQTLQQYSSAADWLNVQMEGLEFFAENRDGIPRVAFTIKDVNQGLKDLESIILVGGWLGIEKISLDVPNPKAMLAIALEGGRERVFYFEGNLDAKRFDESLAEIMAMADFDE